MTDPRSRRPDGFAHRPWLALLGLWALTVLVTTGQAYAATRAAVPPPSLVAILARGVAFWSFWLAAAPVVAALVRGVPPAPGRWARAIPTHLVASVLVSVAAQLCYGVIRRVEGGPIPPAYRTLGSSLRAILLDEWLGVGMLLYAAVAGAVVAIDMTRRYRLRDTHAARREAELETQLVQAQLDALRAQLNPHFLFNALNSVAMLVRANARADAVRVLGGLGELLRHVLYGPGTHEVSLRDELAFVERYLAIERVRFGDRLQVAVDVAPAALDAAVPNLLLQPLVENAIKHGVARRSDGGRVRLAARVDADVLRVEVCDEGAAMPPDWTAPEGGGVGLRNTRARLARLYGARARLDVGADAHGGVRAVVELPWRATAHATPVALAASA